MNEYEIAGNKLAEACRSFGATLEESVRVIEILTKKGREHRFNSTPASTPKKYGQSLRKHQN